MVAPDLCMAGKCAKDPKVLRAEEDEVSRTLTTRKPRGYVVAAANLMEDARQDRILHVPPGTFDPSVEVGLK